MVNLLPANVAVWHRHSGFEVCSPRAGSRPPITGENIDTYYRNFASFYNAILFVCFEASFSSEYFDRDVIGEVKRLVDLVGKVRRRPEVITLEEMNMQPPMWTPLWRKLESGHHMSVRSRYCHMSGL